ncbi:MAG: monofunctional biosynthetic peptidoglycan transglycosylase, partial [Gallionellaceae bacterium]|nr:monofunctional biosynthetic peptidoglycan transglycosylase [Gallionellaceae bacterium]
MKTLWRWAWRISALLLALLLLYQIWIFAHIWWWVDHNPSSSAFMESSL